MKQWILFLMAIVAIQVFAADYTYKYLVFTGSDGKQTTVATDGLTLSVTNNGLVATNSEGSTTLPLSSLAKMEFSEGSTTTPIEQGITALEQEEPVEAYNLSGIYQGTFSSVSEMKRSLGKGVYVITQNGKNAKMIVK